MIDPAECDGAERTDQQSSGDRSPEPAAPFQNSTRNIKLMLPDRASQFQPKGDSAIQPYGWKRDALFGKVLTEMSKQDCLTCIELESNADAAIGQ